jgi:transcription-repair coupling factor (superfamily II helicase)
MSTALQPTTISFHAKPQPSFNKNFDLLIRNLHEWQDNGYEVFICSDNPKQLARLQAIFKELKANVSLAPRGNGPLRRVH